MKNVNLNQVANFIFTLTNKTSQVEFFVQEFSGLGISFNSIEQYYQGIMVKRPGDSLTFTDINLQVLVDEDLTVLTELYDYAKAMKDITTNDIDWDYMFTGNLYGTSNRNWFNKRFEFKNCWIREFSDLSFQSTQTENTPLIVPVTISCDYYEIFDVNE